MYKKSNQISHQIDTVIERVSRILNNVGISLLLAMTMITVVDVALRYIFNRPLKGTSEYVAFMMAIMVSLGLAYTAIQKGNVAVDIVLQRLSPVIRAVVNAITDLISLIFFIFVTWSAYLFTMSQWKDNATTGVLDLPRFPFIFIVLIGCFMLCLVLLTNVIKHLYSLKKEYYK